MKKALSLIVVGSMTLAMLVGCGSTKKDDNKETTTVAETTAAGNTDETTTAGDTDETTVDNTDETTVSNEVVVMSYAEYMAAAKDDKVVVQGVVQGVETLKDGNVSIFLQNEDGAYFVYNIPSAEETKLISVGMRLCVEGYKSEWSGEIEIVDVNPERIAFGPGEELVEPKDITEYLGKDEIIDFQNQAVKFTDLEVVSADKEKDDVAFLYNWDGSGAEGDDLYFSLSNGTDTFSFVVETSLTDADSDVYATVKNLKVGDKVDVSAFLYWYEGINPHVTSVTVK